MITALRPRALIVDLDGTLEDIRVRLKHLEGKKKDWCRDIINRFAPDHKIILIT